MGLNPVYLLRSFLLYFAYHQDEWKVFASGNNYFVLLLTTSSIYLTNFTRAEVFKGSIENLKKFSQNTYRSKFYVSTLKTDHLSAVECARHQKDLYYRISSYSFRGNYSFLNLEIVENLNSLVNFNFLPKVPIL